jgi:hypothetical protein
MMAKLWLECASRRCGQPKQFESNEFKYATANRHSEQSEAKSKDPVVLRYGHVSGFLDFARNDGMA